MFAFIFCMNEFAFAVVLTRIDVLAFTVKLSHYFGNQLGMDCGTGRARLVAGLRRDAGHAALSRARDQRGCDQGLAPAIAMPVRQPSTTRGTGLPDQLAILLRRRIARREWPIGQRPCTRSLR